MTDYWGGVELVQKGMMLGMEYEPTSDDIDRLLEADPGALGERLEATPDLRVHIEVPMDGATLQLLKERAALEDRSFADVVRDAVDHEPST